MSQVIDNSDDEIPAEIDFSRGQRGNFYRLGTALRPPVDWDTQRRSAANPWEVPMTQLCVELPDAVHSVLHCAPADVDRELRLAAAVQWYQQGRISQEWAAKIAGLDRTDFLLALARLGKDSFLVDFEDLDRELAVAVPPVPMCG